MSALVLAELADGALDPRTASTVAAAAQHWGAVSLLVAGAAIEPAVAAAQRLAGVAEVLVADAPPLAHGAPENTADLLLRLAATVDVLLASDGPVGRAVLPRAAALLGLPLVANVTAVEGPRRFRRTRCAGRVLATVECVAERFALTVCSTAFRPVPAGPSAAPRRDVSAEARELGLSRLVARTPPASDGLRTARVVVGVGGGAVAPERFAAVRALAETLGASLAGTRASVQAGRLAPAQLIGQSGDNIAPDVYLALGVSGAAQHLSGVQDARYVVAINRDAEAPIFAEADLGLVADLGEAVPRLDALLKENR